MMRQPPKMQFQKSNECKVIIEGLLPCMMKMRRPNAQHCVQISERRSQSEGLRLEAGEAKHNKAHTA